MTHRDRDHMARHSALVWRNLADCANTVATRREQLQREIDRLPADGEPHEGYYAALDEYREAIKRLDIAWSAITA